MDHLNSFRIGGRPPVEVDVSGTGHGEAEPGFVVLTLQRIVLPEMTLKQKHKVIKVKYALMTLKQKSLKVLKRFNWKLSSMEKSKKLKDPAHVCWKCEAIPSIETVIKYKLSFISNQLIAEAWFLQRVVSISDLVSFYLRSLVLEQEKITIQRIGNYNF